MIAARCNVPMQELTPLMEEILASGGTVELTATGSSMRPMLLDRVSKVRLAAPTELRRGDIPLYRRDNGGYVLHRIIAVEGDTYTLCGDAQWHPEQGIRKDQILAVVTDFARRDRWISCDHTLYILYWHCWVAIRPVRHLVFGGFRRLRRMLK